MKILKYLFILVFFCCFKCIDDKELIINNNSNNEIYLTLSLNDEIFDYDKYLLRERLRKGEEINGTIDITWLFFSEEINPKSTYNWKAAEYFKGYINSAKDKKVRIFIFDKKLIEEEGWKKLHAKNLYSKKYIYSYDELEQKNWKINYNNS